mgnify:CR=1 FL=1
MITDRQLQKSNFWYHKYFARWIRQADTVCKGFFQPHHIKSHKSQLTSMRRVDGSFTSDVVEMRDIASSFYSHLLTAALISMGFWVASSSPPQDMPTLGFIWVP